MHWILWKRCYMPTGRVSDTSNVHMQWRMDGKEMWYSAALPILLRWLHPWQFDKWVLVSLSTGFFDFIQTNCILFNVHRCADGTIKPCSATKYGYAPAAMEAVSVLSIACFLIVIVLLLVVLLGSVVYVIRFGHLNNYFCSFLYIRSASPINARKFCVFWRSFLFLQKAQNMSAILSCTTQRMRWNDKSNVRGRTGWHTSIHSNRWNEGELLLKSLLFWPFNAIRLNCYICLF